MNILEFIVIIIALGCVTKMVDSIIVYIAYNKLPKDLKEKMLNPTETSIKNMEKELGKTPVKKKEKK